MRYQLAEYIGSPCHIQCTTNRFRRRECFPAAVSVEHHIFGQDRKQPLHVARSRSLQKLLEKVELLSRDDSNRGRIAPICWRARLKICRQFTSDCARMALIS